MDVDHHAVTVQITNLQMHRFTDSQTKAYTSSQTKVSVEKVRQASMT